MNVAFCNVWWIGRAIELTNLANVNADALANYQTLNVVILFVILKMCEPCLPYCVKCN